jgi:hypothetical protein
MRANTLIPSVMMTIACIAPAATMEEFPAPHPDEVFASFPGRPSGIVPPPTVVVSDAVDAAPLIQIAVLLDTSNSMDGLINQARSQLWAIVNSLGRGVRGGRQPALQVALYEYGKSTIAAEEQHLRQVLPFTSDLDRVSEQLFALTTKGGEEYCGAAIRAATRGLGWSADARDLKVMIIAGNEPFTQGAADYRASCVEAVASRGIVINTIFCGPTQEGIDGKWQDGARLGNGAYAAIDQQRVVVVPPAPQDAELARLGIEINDTYVPYGRAGDDGALNQKAQDGNSLGISTSNLASRACAKGGASYCNERWDLVDAVERKAVALAALAPADLPEGLRALTPEQRAAYLAGKLAERKRIQARIGQLAVERERFLAFRAKDGAPSLDDVIIAAIRAQATRLGFLFR